MKKQTLIVVVLAMANIASAAYVLNDGQTHNIDYVVNSWQYGSNLEIWDSSQGDKTTVNILPGADIDGHLDANDNSQVNMSGGSIESFFYAEENSKTNFSGGYIGASLLAYNYSQVYMSGGSIGIDLEAHDNSQITVSGGMFRDLEAEDNSQIYLSGGVIGRNIGIRDSGIITIYGYGFAIDGFPVETGTYGVLPGDVNRYGILTGTLQNGDVINNGLYIIETAKVVLAPPPYPPVANAGSEQTVTDSDDNGFEQVTLDGSGSSDSNGTVVNWEWTDDLGDTIPDGETVIAALSVGVHTITLTATDNDGLTATDTVTITVGPKKWNLTIEVDPNAVGIDTIDPSIGQHVYDSGTLVNLDATRFVECPNVRRFDHWVGDVADTSSAQTTVVIDGDKTVTAVFTVGAVCGDECHPNFLLGDLNHDCAVDLADLAMLASRWMTCTKPECD